MPFLPQRCQFILASYRHEIKYAGLHTLWLGEVAGESTVIYLDAI